MHKFKRIDEDYFDHVDDLNPDMDVEKELEDDAESLEHPIATLHLDFFFNIENRLLTASEVQRISQIFIRKLNYICKMGGDVIKPSEPIYPCYEEENEDEDNDNDVLKRINFNHFGNSELEHLREDISNYFELRLDCASNMKNVDDVARFLASVFSIKVLSQVPGISEPFVIQIISIGGTENSALMNWSFGNIWASTFNDKHRNQVDFINAMRIFCEHLIPSEPGTDWAEEVKEYYTKRYYAGKEKYPLYGG